MTAVARKTFKREVAATLLLFWAGMTVWGVFNVQAAQASQVMLVPIIGFAATAFGLDSVAKQIMPGRE